MQIVKNCNKRRKNVKNCNKRVCLNVVKTFWAPKPRTGFSEHLSKLITTDMSNCLKPLERLVYSLLIASELLHCLSQNFFNFFVFCNFIVVLMLLYFLLLFLFLFFFLLVLGVEMVSVRNRNK